MATLGSFSVPFDSHCVVLRNSDSVVVTNGEEKLGFDVALLGCLAEVNCCARIILRFAVSMEGGQSSPESFLAICGHGISLFVAELVIRSTGAGLFIPATGHVISRRRSVYYGADCFIPVSPVATGYNRARLALAGSPNSDCDGNLGARFRVPWHGQPVFAAAVLKKLLSAEPSAAIPEISLPMRSGAMPSEIRVNSTGQSQITRRPSIAIEAGSLTCRQGRSAELPPSGMLSGSARKLPWPASTGAARTCARGSTTEPLRTSPS
jgi:hypothetical protein